MSYIFSSNGNNYTFKKLDNMLINMPENDGRHVLVWETVDGVPQYSWTDTSCLVKVNNATLFEHKLTSTQPFNNQWKFELSSSLYLINTSITCYNTNDSLFNECDSIESVVGKGYKVSISMNDMSLFDIPFIDTLNNLVSISDTKLINGIGWTIRVIRSLHPRIFLLSCVWEVWRISRSFSNTWARLFLLLAPRNRSMWLCCLS